MPLCPWRQFPNSGESVCRLTPVVGLFVSYGKQLVKGRHFLPGVPCIRRMKKNGWPIRERLLHLELYYGWRQGGVIIPALRITYDPSIGMVGWLGKGVDMATVLIRARDVRPDKTQTTGQGRPDPNEVASGGFDAHIWYTISDMANEFGLTLRALRFYEDKGLLKPHREGLARLYSAEDRKRVVLILKGKRLGFTLAEIRTMIAAEAGAPDNSDLRVSREKCLEQIRLLHQQRRDIDAAIDELTDAAARLDEMISDAGQ